MPRRVVFVCTGNTCRSPLAEALCKTMLARDLSCAPEELPSRGFEIHSAGMAAMAHLPASPEAVEVAREWGADLSDHRSRPLTRELLEQSDEIILMTRDHQETLNQFASEQANKSRLLCDGNVDIVDPIGCDREVYRQCAETIQRQLERLIREWQTA